MLRARCSRGHRFWLSGPGYLHREEAGDISLTFADRLRASALRRLSLFICSPTEKEQDLLSQQGIKELENTWYFYKALIKPRGLRL